MIAYNFADAAFITLLFLLLFTTVAHFMFVCLFLFLFKQNNNKNKNFKSKQLLSLLMFFLQPFYLFSAPMSLRGRAYSAVYTHGARTSTMFVKKSVKMHSVACQL